MINLEFMHRGVMKKTILGISFFWVLIVAAALTMLSCTTGNDDDDDENNNADQVQEIDNNPNGLAVTLSEAGQLDFQFKGNSVLKTVAVGSSAGSRTIGATEEESTTDFTSAADEFLGYRNAEISSSFGIGHVTLEVTESDWTNVNSISLAEKTATTLAYNLGNSEETTSNLKLELLETTAGNGSVIKVSLSVPAGQNQLSQSFLCGADERFYGFGSQSFATQHRGQTVPLWVNEGGLGKVAPGEERQSSFQGEIYDSHVPVPFFMSSAGYGVYLETYHRAVIELCTEDHADSWRLEVWDDEVTFYVFAADTALELLEIYGELGGNPLRMPPDWFFAPMNDAVRGQENVLRVMNKIRDNNIPSSVMWSEDWIGVGSQATGFRLSHDWDYSEYEYPDFKDMVDDLHTNGFKFLGYFSPFIIHKNSTSERTETVDGEQVQLYAHNQERWEQAEANEYYFTTEAGAYYPMITPPFNYSNTGMDLTKQSAIDWLHEYLTAAEELGLDGSMTDFGEWVPWDAQFANGETGAAVHNEYPVLWAKAHRDFWEEARPDGDYLFYVRSGYSGSQVHASAFWAADQNTNWDRLDGMASVITIGINLGLSGVSFYGHDIAGYSAFEIEGVANDRTTEELFFRWTEIGAYTPMMRTHHGSVYGENWSFEGAPNEENPVEPVEDAETLAHWKNYAEQHIALFPYLKAYAKQSVERGLPIMRHPWLLFPDDEVIQNGTDNDLFAAFTGESTGIYPFNELFQYFLGNELLVAPIISEGSTSRPVYLPEGTWFNIFTNEAHAGKQTITATAAVEEIPVYAPAGAIIPRLPEGVETLVPIEDESIVDHTDVADQMRLAIYLGADGSFTLADGTQFTLNHAAAVAGESGLSAQVSGNSVAVTVQNNAINFSTGSLESGSILLQQNGSTLATLEISAAAQARDYAITMVYQ